MAVEEEFDVGGVRGVVDDFLGVYGVSPMADDFNLGRVAPHSGHHIESWLRQTHGVDFAAVARDLDRDATTTRAVGKNPVAAAGVILGAEFFNVMPDLVDGELF